MSAGTDEVVGAIGAVGAAGTPFSSRPSTFAMRWQFARIFANVSSIPEEGPPRAGGGPYESCKAAAARDDSGTGAVVILGGDRDLLRSGEFRLLVIFRGDLFW